MKWIEIEHRGKLRRVPAVKAAGRIWFHVDGETHVYDLPGRAQRGLTSADSSQAGVLKAPMPGKITKVAATIGQLVKKGTALVVMEAMKMEYTLETTRDGMVAEVNVALGAQVALGQVLVRIVDEVK